MAINDIIKSKIFCRDKRERERKWEKVREEREGEEHTGVDY